MKPEEFEVYVIPPNFMEGGTLFGGLLKTRNTIEAVILGLAVGVPVLHLPFSLTVRVVILCLTALPLVLLALIGVSGMSLSAFIRLFFCFLHNRRILSRDGTQGGKNGKTLLPSWAQQRKGDCEAEDPPLPKSRSRFSVDLKQRSVTQFKTFLQEEEAVQPLNALADYIPIAILGTSGAGKTFTLQLMALRMRRKGIQVFIIAPLKGHEFHRACSNIGGQFISISPASQNCINIMEIRKADKSVDDLLDGPGAEKSLLAAKIQRLHTFFSLLIPDMSHEERQLLDDAMICTYGTKGITHDNASLEQSEHPGRYKEMPILGDLYEILAASPETKRLANILNRLVNGSARSFNQQTNVALDNKYIVLDISELTGDLLTVGMFVALDFVWDKAKENRTAEKAIFVDECWQLIGASSNRQAAESVLELAKTIRGYGGSLVCATQDLNDFFALDDGKYGKGIINNSKTKILLNLEEEEAQRVQGVLHLSEAELMEITHFERGSALISTNNNNIAVEIKCSQMEKELITTDRRELAELAQRAAPKQHPC